VSTSGRANSASKPAQPQFFPTPAEFRAWLEQHASTEGQLLVGFYKKGSGRPSITWPESVDEALCFGWIDGIRRGIDEESYSIRFTPRRRGSIWSAVNVRRIAALVDAGRMTPAGLAAFEARADAKTGVYSFESRPQGLDEPYAERFRAQREAWRFFESQPPGYRRTATFWVQSAKQEATRLRRLDQLIEVSARGERLDALTPPGRRSKAQ
jgi:uncharacterized protein YdeI (YjbR/CyaY-like superfamily)